MASTEICDCKICNLRKPCGLPRLQRLPLDQASAEARKLATEIFGNFDLLGKTLRAYEDEITKRWMEMNQKRRQKLLKKAYPDIPEQHRPDFAYLRDSRPPGKKPDICKEHFDTPQINLTDLCREGALLAWMRSRSEHFPGEFAQRDADNGNVQPDHHFPGRSVEGPLIIMYGKNEANTYGTIMQSDELGEHRRHTTMDPPIGIYVLDIQARIMRFLVSCCRHLLPGADLADLPQRIYPKPDSPRIHTFTWPSIAALELEAAYSRPIETKLSELRVLVAGKISEYEDHLCSLAADPDVWLSTINEQGAHTRKAGKELFFQASLICGDPVRGEPVSGVFQKVATEELSKLLKSEEPNAQEKLLDRMFWSHASRDSLAERHMQLMYWKEIERQLIFVEAAYEQYKTTDRLNRLPEDLEKAFRALKAQFHATAGPPNISVSRGIPAFTELRDHYELGLDFKTTSGEDLTIEKFRPSKKMSGAERRVHEIISVLYKYNHSMYSLSNVVDEIQNLLDNDVKAAALVSPFVARGFANVALLVRMLSELRSIQPWATGWQTTGFETDHEAINRLVEDGNTVFNVAYAYSIKHTIFAADISTRYPNDKAINKQNVAQMRTMETEQDRFFTGFYNLLDSEMKNRSFIEYLSDLLSRWGSPERTKPWAEIEATLCL